ncbi:MAG TPA: type IX secretion system protein PorQ [Bacteroidales bacterium]|nr:type IX secretion system protein PorQ [Bacteroidales bacterium]
MKCICKILVLLFLPASLLSQTGGDNTYEFLNLSTSSLVTALGGINVSLRTGDPSLAYYNPALLDSSSHGRIALNYVNYFAGINYGYASYSYSHDKYGELSAGLTYLNYGKFMRADPAGNITGSFTAAEYALNLIWSYSIDTVYRVGVNLKPVISHLDSYTSLGLAFDIGASYVSRDGLISAGLTLRNAGLQLTTYTGSREKLPFEIISGLSVKLAHAPFRFSVTARHLEKYDMIHDYINDPITPETYMGLGGVTENIMRHLIIGTEFTPSENFFVAAGFNYQRRKELIMENKTSTVGFSLGFGIKLTAFELTYGRSQYHLAGSANSFSLIVKPSAFIKRN